VINKFYQIKFTVKLRIIIISYPLEPLTQKKKSKTL